MATITAYDTAAGKRYRVRYRKPDGSQTDKRGFRTKRDAELFSASVTVSKAAGAYRDPMSGKRPVRLFAEQWLSGRLALLKPSTRAVMETAWRVHVEPKWGDRQVSSIRPSEVQDWIGSMTAAGKAGQTARRAVFVLSGILEIAKHDGILTDNPAIGRDLPTKVTKRKAYLSHAQVDALAAASDQPTLVNLLAYTGARWGEAAALRVRHLDLLRKRYRIEDNAVVVSGRYVIGTPKRGEARTVPIPSFLTRLLATECEGKGRDSFVFGPGDEPLPYPHATSGWFTKAVRACQTSDEDFVRVTPHDLRHSAASFAVSAGANVKAVQRMLGHASAAMTLDVYAELFDDDLDAVAVAVDEARARAVS